MDDLLVIDVSNSRTKIASTDGHRLGERIVLPTAEVTETNLRDLLESEGITNPRKVLVSSVVPSRNEVFRELWGEDVALLDHETDLGIGIDYPRPEQIGADRLANAVATADLLGSPSIAVDFGTAVTFDVIGKAAEGGAVYLGGVIAPGLEAMTTYLHQRTALLPELDLTTPLTSAIGRSTEHAMLAGTVIGYRGLVKEILAEVEAEMVGPGAPPVAVLATGGNAHLICGGIPQIGAVEKNLTLEGLRIVANRIF